jgi:hypothetical protein
MMDDVGQTYCKALTASNPCQALPRRLTRSLKDNQVR